MIKGARKIGLGRALVLNLFVYPKSRPIFWWVQSRLITNKPVVNRMMLLRNRPVAIKGEVRRLDLGSILKTALSVSLVYGVSKARVFLTVILTTPR